MALPSVRCTFTWASRSMTARSSEASNQTSSTNIRSGKCTASSALIIQSLEGVRSLVARADRCKLCSAATSHPSNGGPLLVPRLQGTAALQVNVVFQGGMASVPSQFSPCLLEGLADLLDGTEPVPPGVKWSETIIGALIKTCRAPGPS